MARVKNAAALLLILQLAFGAFTPRSLGAHTMNHDMPAGEMNSTSEAADPQDDATGQRGLRFRLSEGAEAVERPATNPTPMAAKLTEDEAQKVLARLPALKTSDEEQADFNFREKSLPPPRTGQTTLVPFPAATGRDTPDVKITEALQIARHAPTGEVPLAPQLSVTFSQPMSAVTSHAELAAEQVPVRLTPQPAGRWRWVGTKTLLFDPADQRLPMATEYAVSVPAGTRSANGATLKTAGAWTFSTPAPQVRTKFPEGQTVKRDALMFIEFDQRIDPAAVLGTVRARGGAANLKLRLATDDEIAADENVSRLAKMATKNRWLAFRAVGATDGDTLAALPADSGINVTIGPGTPSLEGPRVTPSAQAFSFRTFGHLRVTEHRCGWEKRCAPFDDWWVSFSNNLDANGFDKSQVKITPELPDARISVHGNQLHIGGLKRGRTVYSVTLDGAMKDQFGQTLGDAPALTFNVGSAPPSLASSSDGFTVLDPASAARFSVYSVNHNTLKVTLYSVGAEDWEQFGKYLRHESGYERAQNREQTPPGKPVFSKVIAVKAKPDEMAETRVDLAPALKNGFGQVVVIVESTLPAKNQRERQAVRSWVQVTDIGLDAFVDQTDLVGWATSLKDGRPLEGVRMEILPTKAAATSGGDGLARVALPEKQGLNVLVARKGDDAAMLPEATSWWHQGGSWHRKAGADFLRWYVFDDRKMYRPGEEVSVKGWIRRLGSLPRGDVGALDGAAETVAYTLRDSRGNEITKGTMRLNALGGFDTKFKLPNTMNLGHASLQLIAQGGKGDAVSNDHAHNFQVQEFRRPEFEVTTAASAGPHFVKGGANVTINAAYYAGGGLQDAPVVWNVTSTPGRFTPPNRGDFTFGKWTPWWGGYHEPYGRMATNTQTFTARTDAAGKHNLRIDFDSVNPPHASSVTAQASVTDVNRQTWTATTTMLVHPADLYVGVRSPRTFVREGEPLVVESIVTDLDGKAIANREVKVRSVLLEWTFEKGAWVQKETNPQECAVRSTNDAVKCTLPTKAGGVYRVTARVLDDRERPNESELTLWVAGGKQPPHRDVTQQKIELIPDRKEYRAGETAEILLQAPFYPAEAVMSLRRSGIVRTERFRINEPSHTLRIPIDEALTPNVHVQIDLVGAAARTDDAGQVNSKLPKRPAFAKGELNLTVPPLARKLQVTATPREKTLEPGAETIVSVEVKDAGGRGVAGNELAVVVVDESVLALTGYKLEDPAAIFYSHRGADVRDYHLRRDVQLSNPEDLAARMQAQGPGRGGAGNAFLVTETVSVTAQSDEVVRVSARRARADKSASAPMPTPPPKKDGSAEGIRLRENFNALAVFAPSVPTDASGRAEVKVKVPDNLTRYRVMAVSVAGGKQFGAGESAITARMPLMVRPSAPRFLNFGDRFELPVVVQNQTDNAMSVDVAVRASNAELTDGAGRRVTVPANDRAEIRFPVAAARAGKARFQIGAAAGRNSDASEIELPVWTPATTEAFATYGEIDAGAVVQPIKAPSNVVPQFGGLEITTSSTQLQALTDAVLYLVAYPYECAEQLSSRVLAVAALRDVLAAFKAKDMPTPDEMKAAVARDIKRLEGMQNEDGGFAFWRRGDESWPYVSIHVAHALVRAKEKGFDVPAGMLDKSKSYLRNIERHIQQKYYSPEARRALVAYALYVRHRMNDRDAAKARSLIASAGLEKLSLESTGWLLSVLSNDANSKAEVAAIRRHLNNRVTETAGAAHFADGYGDGDYLLLCSDRRADGVILEALIGDQPANDLIPKIVRGLLAHRKAGRWMNTQENVFILLALDRYFATYEKTTPDFVARAWLGERFAGDQQFRGRSTDRQQINVPMRSLAENPGAQNLVISKEGAGRLYYRVGMSYAPASLKLDAADYGFTVERVYEAVDDSKDVRRDADGTWRIRAGAKVRVRLTMAAPARRYHVALVDPLPAGLEAMNPALAVTGSIPADQKAEPQNYRWWWRQWFEHQNMRDERVEAFTSLLWEGVHSYSYVARATTPGSFVVPPAKAEEMYHPETFGRGATDRVIVE